MQKEQIEFITIALETCSFMEQAQSFEKRDFVAKSLKLLPLLYLKASLLEVPERVYDEDPERFVSEYDYEGVRLALSEYLASLDDFLTVYDQDMQLSDTPVYATVSENMADIYQELKDYVLCCQYNTEEVQSDALNICLIAFKEHWGQKLLSVMQALHAVLYNRVGAFDQE